MKDLRELFINELRLMYDAEMQIVNALPSVIEAVSSKKLKNIFRDHLEETKMHVERLEAIFKELGQDKSHVTSEVMKSLLKEADKVIQSDYEVSVKDAALINCAQHVEHFEIASYGILKSLAKKFEYEHIHDLLEETSKEEGNVNKKLTKAAEGTFFSRGINTKAFKHAA